MQVSLTPNFDQSSLEVLPSPLRPPQTLFDALHDYLEISSQKIYGDITPLCVRYKLALALGLN